ncbi:helix-turn-helix domain-containing protein [Ralstonia sp. ASV6]|uniref:helix-turn-helix domain-containing protein n=1 Tax=Ralstonia sp. ASV6 TaxID=2795124 RepID=UPI0018EA3D61|nr:helix-turn-helix transcriptional regulator [Ralstonia sp. ASV6]
MSSLGDFIRARRKALGISQTTLAVRIGVDDTYISAVETGKRTPDSEHFLDSLAAALELTAEMKPELHAVARKSQRLFRLPAEISACKHEVIQALAMDTTLTDEDIKIFADLHAALIRRRSPRDTA